MSTGRLKIQFGELIVELEGDNDLLYRSFSDVRADGSFKGSSSSAVKAVSSNPVLKAERIPEEPVHTVSPEPQNEVIELHSTQLTADLPDFNTLILEKRVFTASSWMLMMAWSVSHKGRINFTKKQIRKIYSNSCKHIGLRSKDFVSNFMSLLMNDYVVMIDKNTFALTDSGFKQAYSLLSDANNDSGLNEAI